jgi:hypothetical protein
VIVTQSEVSRGMAWRYAFSVSWSRVMHPDDPLRQLAELAGRALARRWLSEHSFDQTKGLHSQVPVDEAADACRRPTARELTEPK